VKIDQRWGLRPQDPLCFRRLGATSPGPALALSYYNILDRTLDHNRRLSRDIKINKINLVIKIIAAVVMDIYYRKL